MEKHKNIIIKYLIVIFIAAIVGGIVGGIAGIVIVAVVSVVILATALAEIRKSAEEIVRESVQDDDEPEVIVKNDIPVPYVVIDGGFSVMGCNEEFLQLMGLKSFCGFNIKEKIPDYNEHLNNQIVKIGERSFRIYSSHAELADGDIANSLCFMDVTEIQALKESLENDKTVVGIIYIDNYDEVIESVDDSAIPMLTAIVDRKLTAMIHECKGVLKRPKRQVLLLYYGRSACRASKKLNFEIFNDIRSITIGEHIPVTLSIGIGIGEVTLEAAMKSAKAAIDLALGRGGDQALIKNGDKYIFYGGKSGEVSP